MWALCMRHVPMELRDDIHEINFYFVPMIVGKGENGNDEDRGE